MNDKMNQFILAMDKVNNSQLTKEIWIPSLGKYVNSKSLTAKHHKEVLKSNIDNQFFYFNFKKISNDILNDILDIENINNLTIFDRHIIFIQLRYYYIDTVYQDIDLTPIIDNIKNLTTNNEKIIKDSGGYIIYLKVPTIDRETQINNDYILHNKVNISPDGTDEVRKNIDDLYVLEVIKYIDTMTIKGVELSLDFNQNNISDLFNIINNLNHDAWECIKTTIEEIRKIYNPYITLTDEKNKEINILFTPALLLK